MSGRAIAAVLLVAVVAVCALVAPRLAARKPAPPPVDFALAGPDGHPVSAEQFRGKWVLVYFGYTHSPDATPSALRNIGAALGQLAATRHDVVALFVTVDPERDTRAALGAYVDPVSPAILPLTGSQAEIDAAERALHIYAKRQDRPNGGYVVDHSNAITVLDPSGRIADQVDGSAPPGEIEASIGKSAA